MGVEIHQGVPATPPWEGTFVSQMQSRPQPPGKLPLPQLLLAVALVLRPTSCTPQLSTGPQATCQPGTPVSRRLRTLDARPPTQLRSWSCSPERGAQATQQLHLPRPSPRTSCRGAPSPYHTQVLAVTWMWAPSLCTELSQGHWASTSHHKPPFPSPSPIAPHSTAPSPTPNGCLRPAPRFTP